MDKIVILDDIENKIMQYIVDDDIQMLSKLHAAIGSKEFRKRIYSSIRQINRCEKNKIKIEMAFGDYYKNLEDETINRYSSLTGVTSKQQAEDEINKNRVSINKYVRMSDIPNRDEILEECEAFHNDKSLEMTTAAFMRYTYKERNKDIATPQLPDEKYRIIYADPPWKYDKGKELSTFKYGDVDKHYPPMEIDEICALKINNIADSDCVLFLWTTAPKLPEGLKVIESWGFQYKTNVVWDKIKHNFGFYFSIRHEHLLIAGIGKSTPDIKKLHDSVISIERSKSHSEKPDHFRKLIDELYPTGNRIELFPRGNLPENWDRWGGEL